MFRNVLFAALIIGLLATPAFADSISFSGTAALDWSALTMTGINFTLSDFSQAVGVQGGIAGAANNPSVFQPSNNWLPAAGTLALAAPLGVGAASTSDFTVRSFLLAPVVSNNTSLTVDAFRNVSITALSTGLLTVSIPYHIQDFHVGDTGSEWFSFTAAGVQFTNPDHLTGLVTDMAVLQHLSGNSTSSGESITGIVSISIPLIQGQTGLLNFDARSVVAGVVPEPGTFSLIAISLLLWGLLQWQMARRTESDASRRQSVS